MIIQELKLKNRFALLSKFLIFATILLSVALPIFALAASKSNIACDLYRYPWCGKAENPGQMVATFYQIALGLAGGAALAVIIYGAILYTLSAGNASKQQDARNWITGAVWGLVLLLGAYLILYTINPDLVNLGKTQKFLDKLIVPVEIPKTQPEVGERTEGGVVGRTIKEEGGKQTEGRSVYSCVNSTVCRGKGGTTISSILCQTRTNYALSCNVGAGEICCEVK